MWPFLALSGCAAMARLRPAALWSASLYRESHSPMAGIATIEMRWTVPFDQLSHHSRTHTVVLAMEKKHSHRGFFATPTSSDLRVIARHIHHRLWPANSSP